MKDRNAKEGGKGLPSVLVAGEIDDFDIVRSPWTLASADDLSLSPLALHCCRIRRLGLDVWIVLKESQACLKVYVTAK